MPVFISHCHEDRSYYSNICNLLDSNSEPGSRWDPKKMAVGQSIADQLKSAINSCEACIFIASPKSVQSLWCMAELGAFWGAGKTVLIYIADSNVKESNLPPQFTGDLYTYEHSVLLDAVRRYLKPEVAAPLQIPAGMVYKDIQGIMAMLAREEGGRDIVFKIRRHLNKVHLGRNPAFKVGEVKEMLHQLELYTRAEGEDEAFDSNIHPAFIEAVMNFQIRYHLALVDGIIGPNTKQMLKKKVTGQAE